MKTYPTRIKSLLAWGNGGIDIKTIKKIIKFRTKCFFKKKIKMRSLCGSFFCFFVFFVLLSKKKKKKKKEKTGKVKGKKKTIAFVFSFYFFWGQQQQTTGTFGL